MRLPRFLGFANYEVIDFQEFLTKGEIHIHLRAERTRQRLCHRRNHELSDEVRADHIMRVESLPIMGHRTYIHFRDINIIVTIAIRPEVKLWNLYQI